MKDKIDIGKTLSDLSETIFGFSPVGADPAGLASDKASQAKIAAIIKHLPRIQEELIGVITAKPDQLDDLMEKYKPDPNQYRSDGVTYSGCSTGYLANSDLRALKLAQAGGADHHYTDGSTTIYYARNAEEAKQFYEELPKVVSKTGQSLPPSTDINFDSRIVRLSGVHSTNGEYGSAHTLLIVTPDLMNTEHFKKELARVSAPPSPAPKAT